MNDSAAFCYQYFLHVYMPRGLVFCVIIRVILLSLDSNMRLFLAFFSLVGDGVGEHTLVINKSLQEGLNTTVVTTTLKHANRQNY